MVSIMGLIFFALPYFNYLYVKILLFLLSVLFMFSLSLYYNVFFFILVYINFIYWFCFLNSMYVLL